VRALLVAACLAALPGCLSGYIYTHTVRPLTTDLHDTPVVPGPGVRSSLVQVRYSNYIDVRVGNNGIGEIARQNGIARVYYADIEVFRILGIFTQTYVRIYGEKAPAQ
jgi:hypothetical protein